MSEYKNLFKGTLGFMILTAVVFAALRFTAGEMNAGAEGFGISLPFLSAQAAVNLVCYIFWYTRVNALSANMMKIGDMRKAAFRLIFPYAAASFLLTSLIAGAAAGSMFLGILFTGIPRIYCFSSVITMLLVGNLAFLLMMRFLALPNRVTGYY